MCTCRSGYSEEERGNCGDENECTNGKSRCPKDSLCVNLIGRYTCTCADGLRYDSALGVCVDVDECYDPEVCADPKALCVNSLGGFSCRCKTGYEKNESSVCIDVNECTDEQTTYCSWVGAVCHNGFDGYSCDCRPGKKLIGFSCIDNDNECGENSPCGENSICTVDRGAYSCNCADGYFGDGILCLRPSVACLSKFDRTACSEVGGSNTVTPNVILLMHVSLVITLALFH